MKRITTTIIICLCMLLLCGCGVGREWIAAGTEDMPIAVFRSWINSAGELSTVEYAACDNGAMKHMNTSLPTAVRPSRRKRTRCRAWRRRSCR